jgi:hypothetical protein
MTKCRWEKESISPSCPKVVHIRCKYPFFDKTGKLINSVDNCIGYETCYYYEKIKKIK